MPKRKAKRLTVLALKTSWTPEMNHGTWHPRGKRLLGPITYIQSVRGQPTSLFFVVSRLRYWWIYSLVKARSLPLLGGLAGRLLAQLQVNYYWTWTPDKQFHIRT